MSPTKMTLTARMIMTKYCLCPVSRLKPDLQVILWDFMVDFKIGKPYISAARGRSFFGQVKWAVAEFYRQVKF